MSGLPVDRAMNWLRLEPGPNVVWRVFVLIALVGDPLALLKLDANPLLAIALVLVWAVCLRGITRTFSGTLGLLLGVSTFLVTLAAGWYHALWTFPRENAFLGPYADLIVNLGAPFLVFAVIFSDVPDAGPDEGTTSPESSSE